MTEPGYRASQITPLVRTLALSVSIAGGLLLVAADAVRLPLAVGLTGAALLLAGTAVVATMALQYFRRSGRSVPRSIWLAARTAWQWLWFFIP